MYFSCENHIAEILRTLYETKKHTDLELIAGSGGKRFKVHKNILVAATEYFDTMFEGPSGNHQEVIIKDVDANTLELVIKFIYCGIVEILSIDQATRLLPLAHQFRLITLVGYCKEYLNKNTAMSPIYFDQNYQSEKLQKLAVKEFEDVLQDPEFLQLSKDSLIEYIYILKDVYKEKGQVISDDTQAIAILNWVDVDSKRDRHFSQLLQLLDIEYINRADLVNDLKTKCSDLRDLDFILNGVQKRCFSADHRALVPIRFEKHDMLMFVIINEDNTKEVLEYDTFFGDFWSLQTLDIGGNVLGFWNGKFILETPDFYGMKIITYDLKKDQTHDIGTFTIKDYLESKVKGDTLYIINRDFCLQIEIETGELKTLIVPTGFWFETMANLNGQLYYIVYDSHYTNTVKLVHFDQIKCVWISSKSVDVKNSDPSKLTALNGLLYYFNKNEIYIYDPIKDSWTEIEASEEMNGVKSVITINERLFSIIGDTFCKFNEDLLFNEICYVSDRIFAKEPIDVLMFPLC